MLLESLEARRERIRTQAGKCFLEVLKPARTQTQQVAQEQDCPAFADDIERPGNGAFQVIAGGHFFHSKGEWALVQERVLTSYLIVTIY